MADTPRRDKAPAKQDDDQLKRQRLEDFESFEDYEALTEAPELNDFDDLASYDDGDYGGFND